MILSHQRFVGIEGTPTDTRPGKHTTNYGKSPFYSWVDHGRSTISMAIVNSFLYVYQRVSWESDFSKLSCGWEIHSFLISHFLWGRWMQFQSCGKPNAINLPFRNSLQQPSMVSTWGTFMTLNPTSISRSPAGWGPLQIAFRCLKKVAELTLVYGRYFTN